MTDQNFGCSCGSADYGTANCCPPVTGRKQLTLDFLYLDLQVCERCQGADKNLEEAILEVSPVLKAAGYEVTVNKVNITSKELAEKHLFISSPTLRINGKDITIDVKESNCRDCGDLCGDTVDCRVFTYDGVDYDQPPKELIINAIFKEVYGAQTESIVKNDEYILPENLRLFFEGQDLKANTSIK